MAAERLPNKISPKEAMQQIGFRRPLATIAGAVLGSGLSDILRPPKIESGVVEQMTAAEEIYCMFPKEARLVDITASMNIEGMFDTKRLAEATHNALTTLKAPHQPLQIYIDEEASSFDLRQPASIINVAYETEKGWSFTAGVPSDLGQIQAVISKGCVLGLMPKQYLEQFPGAFLYISQFESDSGSDSEHGLRIEADHLVMDGAMMEAIMAHLLINSEYTATSPTRVLSDRKPCGEDISAVRNLSVRDTMQSLGKTSSKLGGSNAHTWVTSTRKTEDCNPGTTSNRFNRIIPIPVNSANLGGNDEQYTQAKSEFQNPEQDTNATGVAAIIQSSVNALGLSRNICKQIVSASKAFPFAAIGELPNILTALWPKLDYHELNIPDERTNKTIGDNVKSITARINLFPEKWGPLVVARPHLLLPTASGNTKKFCDFAVSGKSAHEMQEFVKMFQQISLKH